MAKRNTAPIVPRARVAVSCRPRFSIFRKASRISGALISEIGRLPNSLLAKSSSHCFFFSVFGASPSAFVGPRHSRIAALFLAVEGGVDTFCKQLLGIVALDSRVRERSDRILA